MKNIIINQIQIIENGNFYKLMEPKIIFILNVELKFVKVCKDTK